MYNYFSCSCIKICYNLIGHLPIIWYTPLSVFEEDLLNGASPSAGVVVRDNSSFAATCLPYPHAFKHKKYISSTYKYKSDIPVYQATEIGSSCY